MASFKKSEILPGEKDEEVVVAEQEEEKQRRAREDLEKFWTGEIEDGLKREKDYRTEGGKIEGIYEALDIKPNQFNILYSNTETLAPALYSNRPTPVTRRRFTNPPPGLVELAACTVCNRVLTFLLDSGDQDFPTFDELLDQAVLEGLITSRGAVEFMYTADISKDVQPEDERAEADAGKNSPEEEAFSTEKVTYETVVGEGIPWNRMIHGYAKSWANVPWIALEYFMSKAELELNFPDDFRSIPLDINPSENSSDRHGSDYMSGDVADAAGAKLAHIWKIFDKNTRKVLFLAPSGKTRKLIKVVDDPLGLHGFFPIPRPIGFSRKISSLLPRPLYVFYREQAEELNTVTVRINKILDAIKVRGFYDSTIGDLAKLFEQPDATLLPAENLGALQDGQTLERAIFLMPIDKLINVLQQLYQARMQIKQTIYEITGISDIIRGSSQASETATAQNIKSQWGTLRLQRMQKEVQRFVVDSLRIMAEIAFCKFSIETIIEMTGLDFPRDSEKVQLQSVLMELQQRIAQSQMPQQPAQPGQPPTQPQIDPQVQQQIAQIQLRLQMPSWESIIALLKSDLRRRFKIDIQSNSTITAEATEDKQNIGDFMNALGQMMNALSPMVEQGVLPFEAAKQMLLTVVRKFRFGTEVEEELDKMQPPQQKPDPKDDKAKADAQKTQAEIAAIQADAQAKQQTAQMELAIKQQEAKLKQQEMALKLQEMERKAQFAEIEFQRKVRLAELDYGQKLKEMQLNAALRSQQLRNPAKGKA